LQELLSPTHLSLSYNIAEDRLIIIATGQNKARLALLLTRRLTERLINGLAALLEKSSVVAARAPAELRGDVVLLEHQVALDSSPSGAEEERLNWPPFRPDTQA